ncbi:MAG TPA: DUF58 domain-containing protein [Vicinamibacterales bacterium]|jgi:uncharacterized protein (DUF58 family)|nr:DUF58 domain-containing protein [Vicinamibacterales bacterium]
MAEARAELRFLDPAVVARLGSMELRAKTIVEGFLSGLHRSPFKGFSVEFAEYRQYLPGDDLSTIDWKVYARSDRYYVKKYEEDTNLDCHILLDVSASMAYASGEVTKLAYGSFLAAALAYLMNRQRDAVGFLAFDEGIVDRVPASARPGHLKVILLAIARVRPGSRSAIPKPLHRLAEALARRSMVIVISDLLDDPEAVASGLRHLRFSGTDVIVFHVLDPAELTFPFDRPARFRDLESHAEVLAVPSSVREEYLRRLAEMLAFYERELRGAGIDYVRLSTAQPLDAALVAYLATRARRQ